jgi:hypothetical protein
MSTRKQLERKPPTNRGTDTLIILHGAPYESIASEWPIVIRHRLGGSSANKERATHSQPDTPLHTRSIPQPGRPERGRLWQQSKIRSARTARQDWCGLWPSDRDKHCRKDNSAAPPLRGTAFKVVVPSLKVTWPVGLRRHGCRESQHSTDSAKKPKWSWTWLCRPLASLPSMCCCQCSRKKKHLPQPIRRRSGQAVETLRRPKSAEAPSTQTRKDVTCYLPPPDENFGDSHAH